MSEQNNNFLYENFDFKNSSIIQPPTKSKDTKIHTKMKYVLIDSRDRNMLRYPNSNKFTIHLDEVIKDVTEIELMSAYIPSSNYTISKNNDRVYFIKSTTTMSQLYVNNTLVKSEIYYAKLKHGKYIPGVKIPIKSKKIIRNSDNTMVVLAWNFFKDIKKNNSNLSKNFINIKELEN